MVLLFFVRGKYVLAQRNIFGGLYEKKNIGNNGMCNNGIVCMWKGKCK